MRGKMYKKNRRKNPLPEIQEENLADPLLHSLRAREEDPEANGSGSDDSDSPLTSHIQKAAALVDQAMQGRFMPLDVVHHKDYLSAKQAFLLYHHLRYPRCIVLLTLITLSLFEVPSWCKGQIPNPCPDAKEYLLSGVGYLPPIVTLVIEVLCLLLLAWSVALQRYFKFISFWNTHITIMKVALLSALAFSICVSKVESLSFIHGKKVSMYLRVLIPIFFSRALRGCFRVALRVLEHYVTIGVVVLAYVLLAAWMATLVMKNEFTKYPATLLKLFSLLTAANDADVWSATYPDRLGTLFLLVYLVVGLFFLMNVVFAVMYTNFKAQMAIEAKKQVTSRQGSLRAAFSLLDTRHQEWIDGPTMIALFLAIGNYRHIPDVRSRTSQLFLALNKRGDFKIWSDDFEDLCDVIAKEVAKRPKGESFSRYQQFEMMWVIGHLQFVKSKSYEYGLWALTFLAMATGLYALHVVNDVAIALALYKLEFFFGCLFLLDTILKLVVLGRRNCFHSPLNCYDAAFSFAIMGTLFAGSFNPSVKEWVSILLVLRSFRMVTIFSYFERWKLLCETIVGMVGAAAPILGMLFCICSLFSLLGVHVFQGKVYQSNPRLDGTQYASSELWVLNFNDYASAIATTLNLCIVGNWYIIMQGYVAATGSRWARLYFISFWFITVAFTLSVVVAYFVEVYTIQMDKAKARERARLEQVQREAMQRAGQRQRTNNPGQFMIFKKTVSFYNTPVSRRT